MSMGMGELVPPFVGELVLPLGGSCRAVLMVL